MEDSDYFRWLDSGRGKAGPLAAFGWYSPKCVEDEFCELRLYRILGSCASPCSHSYLSSLRNTAGLTSPALSKGASAYVLAHPVVGCGGGRRAVALE